MHSEADRVNDSGSCFSGALPSIDNLTCSIGGCRFAYGQNIEDVYAKADQLLYEAKKKGRNCYVLGKLEERSPFGAG